MSVFDTLLRKCQTHFVPKGWTLWKPRRQAGVPTARDRIRKPKGCW